MTTIKGVIRSIKNEINNYDEGERLVREVTSNERTPPSRQMLIQLQLMLGDRYQFETVVKMLFKRLKDYNNIRHVEKSLICIEFLLKNADRKFVRYCQMDKLSIKKLTRYRYILGNHNGQPIDYGGNVRKRAKRIVDLLDKNEKLQEQRAKAQGHYMETKKKPERPKSKPPQKKKKPKKKKSKKKKEPEALEQPQEHTFFDIPDDKAPPQNAKQPSGDLLSGDWWQQDGQNGQVDPFADAQDDEFDWFDTSAQVVADESGVGDDGGAFGFGNDEDFANEVEEEKSDELDADAWMNDMTQMDNVLDGSIQKKDPNKRNKQGKSMAAMASNNPMPSFGADDFFETNSGNASNQVEDTFDPFGMGSSNANSGNGASNITSLYGGNQNQNQNFGGNFGYQGRGVASAYNADPFAGIGSGNGAPQPANFVPRRKQQDPFAQFGNMKK